MSESCLEDNDVEPVVIDNGTWMCKAGYSGDKTARVYERTIIGQRLQVSEDSPQGEYVGEKACIKRDVLALRRPMEHGVVQNWDDMEKFWDFIFNTELKNGVWNQQMLITEIPTGNQENRKQMVEMLFEKFNVSGLYISDPTCLALYSSGRTTGLVMDIGASVIHTAVQHRGTSVLPESQDTDCRTHISAGGDDVTRCLAGLLNFPVKDTQTLNRLMDAEDLKHFLSSDYHLDETQYKLPDGTVVEVTQEMRRAGHTHLADTYKLDCVLGDILDACDEKVRDELLRNIILTGGGTMSQGLVNNLQSRLELRYPEGHVKVIAPPERRKSSWLGGSILASLEEFQTVCKSRAMYTKGGWAEFRNFDNFKVLQVDS